MEDVGNVDMGEPDENGTPWRWSALNGASGMGSEGLDTAGAVVQATKATAEAVAEVAPLVLELNSFFGEGFTAALGAAYRVDARWGPVWEEPDLHAGYSRVDGVLVLDDCRTVIPKTFVWDGEEVRGRLVEHAHLELAHAGGNTCFEHLRRSFYWKGMWGDVKDHSRGCERCARTKSRSGKEPGVAMGMAVAGLEGRSGVLLLTKSWVTRERDTGVLNCKSGENTYIK